MLRRFSWYKKPDLITRLIWWISDNILILLGVVLFLTLCSACSTMNQSLVARTHEEKIQEQLDTPCPKGMFKMIEKRSHEITRVMCVSSFNNILL